MREFWMRVLREAPAETTSGTVKNKLVAGGESQDESIVAAWVLGLVFVLAITRGWTRALTAEAHWQGSIRQD
jgi:hypothetical protein